MTEEAPRAKRSLGDLQRDGDYCIPQDPRPGEEPSKRPRALRRPGAEWPLLLKDYDSLRVRSSHYTPIAAGNTPLRRPIEEYLKYGVINLDKPANPSSHEVVSWIKAILGCERTGHSGTLDPAVSGSLIVCLNRATRLVKAQQQAGKEYVGIVRFHDAVDKSRIVKVIESDLTGPLFQRPPVVSSVKRQLRIRTVHSATVLDWCPTSRLAVFRCVVEAGSYVRTMCIHYGLMLGVGAHMQELRRVRSGILGESDCGATLHDVLDAAHLHKSESDEAYLRRVVQPCELILRGYPRIVVKDSCVNAICYGAPCMMPGVLRFEDGITAGATIVLMSSKGEGVALATATMDSSEIASADHGIVAKVKRVVMDRDTYPRRWGLGPVAQRRKALIADGKLSRSGRAGPSTPMDWFRAYVDYGHAAPTNASARTRYTDTLRERGVEPLPSSSLSPPAAAAAAADAAAEDKSERRAKRRALAAAAAPAEE